MEKYIISIISMITIFLLSLLLSQLLVVLEDNIFRHVQGSFFSSAGGGPVSCEVGLAVLKAIEADQLQRNAAQVSTCILPTDFP